MIYIGKKKHYKQDYGRKGKEKKKCKETSRRI